MNIYLNIILISAVLLVIFPFLSFPELWENIYVATLAFLIAYFSMLARHKSISLMQGDDEEKSLEEYVKNLKKQFMENEAAILKEKDENKKSISNINLNEE